MKVINIYNQTFADTNTNGNQGNFIYQFAPYIIKSRPDSKWKITVVSIGIYKGVNVVDTTLIFATGMCDAKSALQVVYDDPNKFNTWTTLGSISMDTTLIGNTVFAPIVFTCDNLASTPFDVMLRNADDIYGTIGAFQSASMSMTLRLEEYLE
jgi:hypothetical protein